MSNAIVVGSMAAIAKQQNKSLAETFASCDVVIMVDTSGSMNNTDSRGGKRRYDVACDELANLQAELPGKVAVISFSDTAEFCPSGVPRFISGGTNMADALRFCKVADVAGMKFVLISDGQPDSSVSALNIAKTYTNKIDTVFVGPERDQEARDFLKELALATGGQSATCARADHLSTGIKKMLLSSGGN